MTTLKDLTPDNRNANKGTARGQKMIVASLQEDGFGRSGLLDKNGRIIAGNKTTEASAEVFGVDVEPIIVESDGTKPIYVKRTDLDLDKDVAARRLAYRDNLTSAFSFELDPEVVMADIEAGFDFEAIDISLPDLGELMGDSSFGRNGHVPEDEAPIDRAAELQAKWGTELGQLWQLGNHRLICGDCTDKAVVERVMVENVDLLLTDPPYGINVDLSWLSRANEKANKPRNISSRETVTNDDGTLDLSFVFDFKRWFVWGFPYIYSSHASGWVVWDKWPGVNDGGLGNPIEMAMTNLFDGFKLLRVMWGGYYRDKGEKREPHPTQKPLGVVKPFVELASETVYDPFLGSGTTLIACEQLNRRCRGIEIDPSYIAVTLERWHTLTGEMPVLLDTSDS